GIGAAICERLAHEGASIALTYSRSETEAANVVRRIGAAGGNAIALRSDSGNADDNLNIVQQVTERLGQLDIIVHNAGIAISKPLGEFTASEIDRSFAVNVRSILLTTQAAMPLLPVGGRVIVIGSTVASRTPFPGLALYGASKAALIGLVKGLARDFGPFGVTVNLVEPGPIDTDMNPADSPIAQPHIDLMAIDRYGRAEEVASMVAYLSLPESGLITGTRLAVDGGFSV
ncbi:MAG: SDR family oxidoreductase, partial [Alphaproteobacteria bacterium]|nr:SDR family oxidoreductase [Alphaproteobacteria bacterium]